jgi:hypothetical protein
MNVNYIYDTKGKAEYAVIPIILWERINHLFESEKSKSDNHKSIEFEPKEFKGILSNLNLNIESEISDLRYEWERNF